MDFYRIVAREKKNSLEVLPDWQVKRTNDLMIQGSSFYAVWDEERGMWSRDEFDVRRIVDQELYSYAQTLNADLPVVVLSTESSSTNMWEDFRRYVRNCPDNAVPLDEKLTFENTEVGKKDYVSRRLPYSLAEGSTDAWDEMMSVLYSQEELDKIEWAIGAVVSGDSKKIQKFLVFYGPAGTGKSTVLSIIEKLFSGYTTTFEAKALGSNGGTFATEVFKSNPLVAIQHDGDLSTIEDNSRLNSIISHEVMVMNEKYKASYNAKVNAFLFMGTNKPVKISDAKSGIIRRLIDVHPTGVRIDAERYLILMDQINFELGAIANKCLRRYKEMGKHYYNSYRPTEMMLQTDEFYNYVEAYFDIFKAQDGVSLRQAYKLYKEYCEESNIKRILPQYKFREELRNYFSDFYERLKVGDEWMRSYYAGFKGLGSAPSVVPENVYKIELVNYEEIATEFPSVLDRVYSHEFAQYDKDGIPTKKWSSVKTTLSEIDPTKVHWVKIPESHIVIDFDLVNEAGEKDISLNLEAASKWPPTYTETSKSGSGIHLHYIYPGNVHELATHYAEGIEVKTLLGDSALRRKLSLCNALEIATLTATLPKKEVNVLDVKGIQSERSLRDLVDRNLRKEIHPGTKPSIDFIHKILEDAFNSGLSYDISDMRARIIAFAAKSTNQAPTCLKIVQDMKFMGQKEMNAPPEESPDRPIIFYDVEVYPNLFVVCWKIRGDDKVVRMINPEAYELEDLFKYKLVGFNNRRYDNHILYARYLGYRLPALYQLSQDIINNKREAMFGEAYNLSYTDIYDFSSKKQGLKKFEIELGLFHLELDIPWDEPVPEEKWPLVVDYCVNDVIATEATFEARAADFTARQILADLSGLTVNHTTQAHTAKIIFGDDRNPQSKFIYTKLEETFPGYEFDGKTSSYKGEDPSEGGYVYAEPGIHENVALLDVASMHPTSIEVLDLFGPYTQKFSDIKSARLAIKHRDYETARKMLDGRLTPYLEDESQADKLSYALKIVINIVYGLTSAKFPNPFRDLRNVDNIVAKRGALFMIDLKLAVQERGFTVAHVKTDSIKIPNATQEIIDFVFAFGAKYGYDFEHEDTYDKFCLVNDAVYIARSGDHWSAVGAQFQHPYVYKTLFSNEELTFDDFCETKSVTQGAMYLDFDGDTDDISKMVHVGRTGSFVPVTEGGKLWRVKEGKKYAVAGTKGYFWVDRDVAKSKLDTDELVIDMTYFEELTSEAIKTIEKFGSFEDLIA